MPTARPRRSASRTAPATPRDTRTRRPPLRSATAPRQALCPAPALPSPVGVDAILGPGPDGLPFNPQIGKSHSWDFRIATSVQALKLEPTVPGGLPFLMAVDCGVMLRVAARAGSQPPDPEPIAGAPDRDKRSGRAVLGTLPFLTTVE